MPADQELAIAHHFAELTDPRIDRSRLHPNGIPSHDTFRRLFERLDPGEFQRGFLGSIEARRCWATSDLGWLEGRKEWQGLRSVVFIESERFIGESLSVETRYCLSSLPNDAKLLNEAIKSHWAVENSLHWVLDMTFDEDRGRIKKENALENFGLLRRLALRLLKKESTSKRSIKDKRLKAGWDDGYLLRVWCGNAGN